MYSYLPIKLFLTTGVEKLKTKEYSDTVQLMVFGRIYHLMSIWCILPYKAEMQILKMKLKVLKNYSDDYSCHLYHTVGLLVPLC